MPYVIYDGDFIQTVCLHSIAGSTFVTDSDPDLLYYNLYPSVKEGITSALIAAVSTVVNGTDTFSVNGELYELLANQICSANFSIAMTVTLTLSDGSTVSYAIADANTLFADISTYLTAVYVNYNSLQTALAAATTYTALAAIDYSAGWPSNIL